MKLSQIKHFIFLFLLCVVILSGRPGYSESTDNAVIQWNQALLQAVGKTKLAPPMASRALAIVHTCIYDAWAAYDSKAVGTRLGGTLRRPETEQTDENKTKAVSYAAYKALVDLLPTEKASFDDLMKSLGFDPSDTSIDTITPAGIGNTAANAVIEFRHMDGSNQLGDLNSGAYSDYTGYVPGNTAAEVNNPNKWQPLIVPSTGKEQKFLTPHWGRIIPFALTSGNQILPPAPATFPGRRYRDQAVELIMLSANLNDRTKSIAEYWADGPATVTPPGHWCLFAQFVSNRDSHTLDNDVKMFFALGNALFDAGISVWNSKRVYDSERPVTAIRFLFKDKDISAWAGANLGTQTIKGQDWNSYISTPAFAEYVSGHSTFSAASAEILKSFTGNDSFENHVTISAGSSVIEPGNIPKSDVTLSWKTFSQAANEAGLSRRLGGIHFKDGDFQARKLGRKIGALVWKKAQTYFNGTAN